MKTDIKNIFILTLLSLVIPAICIGQDNSSGKAIVWVKKSQSQPVEIAEIKFRGQTIKSEEEFTVSPDWLKDLEVKVKNISTHTINYIEIQIEFPKDSESNPLLPVRTLFAGQNLFLPLKVPKTGDWLSLLSSDFLSIKMKEYVFDGHKKDVFDRKYPASISNRITLRPILAVFSDGTAWYRGGFVVRDPNNPDNWMIDKKKSSQVKKTTAFLKYS